MRPIADTLADLPVVQGAVLWTMRVWVMGRHHEIEAATRIEGMMERLGAEGAAGYLDGFMFALGGGATRRIGVHCACDPAVGVDERLLLRTLVLAQECRPLEALLLLRGLVGGLAASAVLRSAQGLGTELALAGQFLAAEDDEDGTGAAVPRKVLPREVLH